MPVSGHSPGPSIDPLRSREFARSPPKVVVQDELKSGVLVRGGRCTQLREQFYAITAPRSRPFSELDALWQHMAASQNTNKSPQGQQALGGRVQSRDALSASLVGPLGPVDVDDGQVQQPEQEREPHLYELFGRVHIHDDLAAGDLLDFLGLQAAHGEPAISQRRCRRCPCQR